MGDYECIFVNEISINISQKDMRPTCWYGDTVNVQPNNAM